MKKTLLIFLLFIFGQAISAFGETGLCCHSYSLRQGWNLVGIYLNPTDESAEELLSYRPYEYTRQGNGGIFRQVTEAEQIIAGRAYWINWGDASEPLVVRGIFMGTPCSDSEDENQSGKYRLACKLSVEEGDSVTITAPCVSNEDFTDWSVSGVWPDDERTAKTIRFTMPANPVVLVPNYGGDSQDASEYLPSDLYRCSYILQRGWNPIGISLDFTDASTGFFSSQLWEIQKEESNSVFRQTEEIKPGKVYWIYWEEVSKPLWMEGYTVENLVFSSADEETIRRNSLTEVLQVASGNEVTIAAPEREGYAFTNWTSFDVILEDANAKTITFTMPETSVELTPNYRKIPKYTLAVNGSSSQKGVGEIVVVTAPVKTGYVFEKWSVNGVELDDDTAETIAFAMPDRDVELVSEYTDEFSLTVDGEVSKQVCGETVTVGLPSWSERPYGIRSAFTGWTAQGVDLDDETSEEISFTMPSNDVVLTSNYVEMYMLEVDGSISWKREGETITASAPDKTGYSFVNWSVEGVSVSGKKFRTISFTMPGNSVVLTPNYTAEDNQGKVYMVVDLTTGKVRYTNTAPDLTSDICRTVELWLRRIPGGTFTMGERLNDNVPHKVTLTNEFYIGIFEMTRRQYELIYGEGVDTDSDSATLPVEQVSYNDIRGSSVGTGWPPSHEVDSSSFLGKLRTMTGLAFDLPTEAQWEYACRAGTTTDLNTGKNLEENCYWSSAVMNEAGRYYGNDGDDGTAKVGSYLPNKWGLYDMHGNAEEWCLDWWRDTLETTAVTDPVGASSGGERVTRGGYCSLRASDCTSAARSHNEPSYKYRYSALGFRVICTPFLKYTLTFNGTKSQVAWGALVSLTAPAKDGYEFTAWEVSGLNVEDKTVPTFSFTMPPNDVTVTAIYEKECPSGRTYMVVDLTTGKSWTTDTAPNLADDTCRTSELWLRKIPSGSFVMGSPEDEVGRSDDETQHRVTLTEDFYIGIFEMTQRQYELIYGEGRDGSRPSYFEDDEYYATRPVEQVSYDDIRGDSLGALWPSSRMVDSSSFLGKLCSKTGLPFDLPTEAQWEYACRAGTTTALNTGEDLTNEDEEGLVPHDIAMDVAGRYWYNGGETDDSYCDVTGGTAKVGSYLANQWGLYDMHGNVWEWCLDWYQSDWGSDPVTDPVGASSGMARAGRGGSWYRPYASMCRSASRSSGLSSSDYSRCGFRVICTPSHKFSLCVNGESSQVVCGTPVKVTAPAREGYSFLEWHAKGVALSDTTVRVLSFVMPANDVSLDGYYYKKGEYLVVNLQTGEKRTSTVFPDLSDDACRTTELWLRRIPAGTFTMGSPEDELGRFSEETQHQVTLSEDFYIGVFEMTQKQYELIYGSNPSYYKGDTRPVERVSYNTIRGSSTGAGWPSSHDVDSDSFLGKLRAKTGLAFDLPTEAQWEYACRAETATALNTGKNLTSTSQDSAMDEAGRYYYNSSENISDGKGGYDQHTEVGSYLPNAYGLYDMHGNVWELCLDWYQSDLVSAEVTDPVGATSGSDRVIRGGSWAIYARGCRSAVRGYDPSDRIYTDVGFRVVCTSLTFQQSCYSLEVDGMATQVPHGTVVTLTAPTKDGCDFDYWSADGISLPDETEETISFVMPCNDVTLMSHYDAYLLTVNGTTSPVYCGDTVNLTAPAVHGWHFAYWTAEGISLQDETDKWISFVMPAQDVLLESNYDVDSYALTVEGETDRVNYGTVIFKTVPTKEGYTFTGWRVNGVTVEDPSAETISFTMPANEVTLSANYRKSGSITDGTYLVVDLTNGSYSYTDIAPYLTDDTCRTKELWLRRIPAGTFTMGAPEDEVGRYDGETQHQVTLTEDFYIGVFEMTMQQYELIYYSCSSSDPDGTLPVLDVPYDEIRGSAAGAGWPSSYSVDGDSFLERLRTKTGLAFELPTEAQWEYACRAGTTTALNTGKNLTSVYQDSAMDEAGRYTYNRSDDQGGYYQRTKVGSYLPNAWGLYDMHGNVGEWCLDWYQEDLGSTAVTDPVGATSGSYRVVRGGNSWSSAGGCRSAFRSRYTPYSYGNYGFRVVFMPSRKLYMLTIDGQTTVKTEGEEITATATEKEGYTFTGWTIAGVTVEDSSATTISFTMPAHEVTLTGNYTVNSYKLKVDDAEKQVNYGSSVSQTAPVKEGYSFIGWTVDGVIVRDSYAETISFTMPANEVTLTANYTVNSYELRVYGEWEQVTYGATVSKTAPKREGYTFTGWTITGATVEDPTAETISFPMPANDVTLWMNYRERSYKLTVDGVAEQVDYRATVSKTAPSPTKKGYVFTGWTVIGVTVEDPSAETISFNMPANDVSLTTNYAIKICQLTVNGETSFKTKDEEVTVTAPKKEGYPFTGWLVDGVALDNYALQTLSFTMPGNDVTLTANYADTSKLYLVVNLKTGAFHYSDTAPNLAGNTCRTTELWLRRIPAGTFTMGFSEDELLHGYYDETQHQVTLTKDFYIGIFEMTQKQYELIYGSNPSLYTGDVRPVESVSYDDIRGSFTGAGWPSSCDVDDESFLGKLRAKTGLDFDLPTEAQWEYACRAGTTTALNTGKNLTNESKDSAMDEAGRNWNNQFDKKGGYDQHTKVGSYLPNAWGLYDMHGNVFEWCLDWSQYYLGSAAVKDPVGAISGYFRVVRGGAWNYLASSCRSANRDYGAPSARDGGSPSRGDYGFRVVFRP